MPRGIPCQQSVYWIPPAKGYLWCICRGIFGLLAMTKCKPDILLWMGSESTLSLSPSLSLSRSRSVILELALTLAFARARSLSLLLARALCLVANSDYSFDASPDSDIPKNVPFTSVINMTLCSKYTAVNVLGHSKECSLYVSNKHPLTPTIHSNYQPRH